MKKGKSRKGKEPGSHEAAPGPKPRAGSKPRVDASPTICGAKKWEWEALI